MDRIRDITRELDRREEQRHEEEAREREYEREMQRQAEQREYEHQWEEAQWVQQQEQEPPPPEPEPPAIEAGGDAVTAHELLERTLPVLEAYGGTGPLIAEIRRWLVENPERYWPDGHSELSRAIKDRELANERCVKLERERDELRAEVERLRTDLTDTERQLATEGRLTNEAVEKYTQLEREFHALADRYADLEAENTGCPKCGGIGATVEWRVRSGLLPERLHRRCRVCGYWWAEATLDA